MDVSLPDTHKMDCLNSVAQIIESIIRKTIYQLRFCILVSDQHHTEMVADTDICNCINTCLYIYVH